MDRRTFLRRAGFASAGWALSRSSSLAAAGDGWRTFEVTTRIEVRRPAGPTRVWLPTPLAIATPFQQAGTTTFTAEGGSAGLIEDRPSALAMLAADCLMA